MKRRDFMQHAAMSAAGITLGFGQKAGSRPAPEGYVGRSRIYYQVHGSPTGKPLFIGFPVMASYAPGGEANRPPIRNGFLERLTDRYRVLLVDYPSIGKSRTTPPEEFTIDRACDDMLEVADAAGFKRFAWWGPVSVGAEIGMALASRSERVSAFIGGGWPPLGAPYAGMVEAVHKNLANPPPSAMAMLRDKSQYAQWVAFYESMARWPEARAVASIKCPRMVYTPPDYEGSAGGLTFRFAAIILERRKELEAMGWRVIEVSGPVRDTRALLDPAIIVPIGREFLDKVS